MDRVDVYSIRMSSGMINYSFSEVHPPCRRLICHKLKFRGSKLN